MKRVLGEEHPDTLTSAANLATTYRALGKYAEAEKIELDVLATRKRVLGEEHPDTLASAANLASTYHRQGKYAEAEQIQLDVLETRKRVLGEEHLDTLISAANLVSTYRALGKKHAEAEKILLGSTDPDTQQTLSLSEDTRKSSSLQQHKKRKVVTSPQL